MIDNSDLF
jgi:TNF receptor-associated protein 1